MYYNLNAILLLLTLTRLDVLMFLIFILLYIFNLFNIMNVSFNGRSEYSSVYLVLGREESIKLTGMKHALGRTSPFLRYSKGSRAKLFRTHLATSNRCRPWHHGHATLGATVRIQAPLNQPPWLPFRILPVLEGSFRMGISTHTLQSRYLVLDLDNPQSFEAYCLPAPIPGNTCRMFTKPIEAERR